MDLDSKYNITWKLEKGKTTQSTNLPPKRIKLMPLLFHNSPKKQKLNNSNGENSPSKGIYQHNGFAKSNNSNQNGKPAPILTIQDQRRALPVFGVRNRLLEEIKKRDTVIVLGETGSGKTTQIPQYIHSARLETNGKIAITQPRRVAAISIARRVAQEMKTEIGQTVGYNVRFEDCSCKFTKLKYLTDGMLLREAMADNLLLNYNIVILDEAHERTVHTDVLFGIVKQAQHTRKMKNRPELKIIIMSATMDVDHFSKYFNNAIVLYLEGRTYSVGIKYAMKTQQDYVYGCLITIFQIHKQAPLNEDILVFLTGQEEIESLAHSIRLIAKETELESLPLKVFPLYAGLPSNQQMDVFKPLTQGVRKIILSTNVAETSLTISGVKHVIDSGMVKARKFHPDTGFDVLRIQRTSQEQAWQRAGRAGRESNGFCYRMYTKTEFEAFLKSSLPEIQRCNLSNVVLQLLALGIDIIRFDFLDKPSKEAIASALKQLLQLNAITNIHNPELTDLGRKMSLFPLDPRYSKILLSSVDYECLEEVLSIIALLSCENIYFTPVAKRHEALEARQKYMSTLGDHISLLNIYRAYISNNEQKRWCKDNYLNARNMAYAKNVRSQLAEVCDRCKIVKSSCGKNLEQVIKCMLSGLFMNVAELHLGKQYVTVDSKTAVSIHPSSILHRTMPECVVFSEIVMTGKCYLRTVTAINPEWLHDIVPEYARSHHLTHLTHNDR